MKMNYLHGTEYTENHVRPYQNDPFFPKDFNDEDSVLTHFICHHGREKYKMPLCTPSIFDSIVKLYNHEGLTQEEKGLLLVWVDGTSWQGSRGLCSVTSGNTYECDRYYYITALRHFVRCRL